MPSSARPRLRALTLTLALAAASLPLVGTAYGLYAGAQEPAEGVSARTLKPVGENAAWVLSRSLLSTWRDVEWLSRFAATSSQNADFRMRLDTAKALNDRISWVGLTAPDGTVLVSSNQVLEGVNVSARPWFQAGMESAFAGDVHDAVLLQRLLTPDSQETLRLIDFAAPVRHADGRFLGVLGSHVSWESVRDVVRNIPRPADSEILLVSRNGTVLIGPPDLEGKSHTGLRTIMAAAQGVEAIVNEAWSPNGPRYIATVKPLVSQQGMPSFGWSIVIRQPVTNKNSDLQAVALRIGAPALAGFGLSLLLGLLTARVIARPFETLAREATDIAAGQQGAPPTTGRGAREAVIVAEALTRLQVGRKP